MSIKDCRILVTGPAGQIAFPLAARLARDNEVWGIARFGDAAARDRVEQTGITTRAVDLAAEKYCSVGAMLGATCKLTHSVELVGVS